jgi:succinoglycan biosynthesis transport protein ExoP
MMPLKNDLMLNPGIISGTPAPVAARQEMSIQDLWKVLSRRRWFVLGSLLFCIAGGSILFATATRFYKGAAQIQVQKEAADALSMDNMLGPESQSDAVDSNITLQTQAQILQSDSLALQVVRELNLEKSPDFRATFNPIGWVMGLVAPAGIPDPKNVPLEQAPGRRAQVVKIFESRLKVQPISGTRLITVEYLSTDPRTAAAVVNQLVQDLSDYNFQIRHNATREASGWLGKQLDDLRKQSEDLQAKVVELQRDAGVFSSGQADSQGAIRPSLPRWTGCSRQPPSWNRRSPPES